MPTKHPLTLVWQRILFGLLLLLLLLPALQARWPLVPVRPLGGYTDAAPAPTFSWRGLWNNNFQTEAERFLNDQLGFRPWLVRLRNQTAYSGWHELLTGGIVLGKDQNLYQQGPIDAYLGRFYLGDDEIAFRAKRLRRVQDALQAQGTQLLFLLAPGKARIVPQYLPDSTGQPAEKSNYGTTAQQFAQHGIHTLDAAALLLRWQAAGTPYPLFPRTGTHWSGYAVARMADTLFHHIESLTGRDLPGFSHAGPPTIVTRAADLRYTDNDLGELLNLARDIPPYPMAYPPVTFGPSAGKQRLNALIIGDSFAPSFNGFYPYWDRLLTPESRYWNYNERVHWPEQTPGESRNVADLKLAEQLRGRQLVLLVAMEENLKNLGYGFIDQAFDALFPLTAQDNARIEQIMKDIQNNPGWLSTITQRAAEHNTPLSEELRINATYAHSRER